MIGPVYINPAMSPIAWRPPVASPVTALVWQLGTQTRIGPQGLVMINKPLVERIVRYREQAVPELVRFLDATLRQPLPGRMAVIEALFTAQRLAEAQVSGIKSIYGVTSRLNTVTDPLVLAYLGGLYEKLNETESFGPTLSALVNMAVNRYPQPNLAQNIMADAPESLGGAVLEMIARKSAQETVNQLKKQLHPALFRPLPGAGT